MHSHGECTIDVDLNDFADRSSYKVDHAVADSLTIAVDGV